MTTINHAVHVEQTGRALVVRALTITDSAVVREARHWTTGRRGSAVEDDTALAAADLTDFATEALTLGARALAAMGETGESRAVERMLREVEEKTVSATGAAGELTRRTVTDAVETMDKATTAAKRSIAEAEERSRKELTAAVDSAQKAIVDEVQRTLGGENPALLDRLKPLLDGFGTTVGESARAATDALLRQAVKQFDPADPTSPVAKLSVALAQQQADVTARLDKNHTELTAAVTELATVVKVGRERSNVVAMTPLKGQPFEDSVGQLLHEIAAGLGDEYEATGGVVGLLPRSKRGDGVLHIAGASAGLVVEMTDSPSRAWGPYLDEAERNRGALASLGVVRTTDQNGGQHVRVLGSRRVVLAFDPEHDSSDLLRTVVQLLRAAALAAGSRTGTAELATAEERIAAALEQLSVIDSIKKTAGTIQKSAVTIEGNCTKVTAVIQRLLDEALSALAGLGDEAGGSVSAAEPASGAA